MLLFRKYNKIKNIFFVCFFGLLFFNTLNAKATISSSKNYRKGMQPETMDVKIVPRGKTGFFDENHQPIYDLTIVSNYKNRQEGKIVVDVSDFTGAIIRKSEIDFSIRAGKKKHLEWDIPINDPGVYNFIVSMHLTDYDDTIRNCFAYKPYQISQPVHKPADFDQFWQTTLDELKKVDPKYSVKLDKTKTTATHSVYYVTMQSLNDVTVSGWLTVPKVGGKYPILLGLPGFKVILKPMYADEMVIFQFNVRKTKPAQEEVLEKESDFNLLGIEDKNTYIYRGVYMDCIRALDFLFAYQDLGLKLDVSKIAIAGGSQAGSLGLVTVALDHRAKVCVSDLPVFCDAHDNVLIAQKQKPAPWPTNRYIEYLQKSPNLTMKSILNTLDYFDPQNFTPMIQCPVLMALGFLDNLAPPLTVLSAYNKLSDEVKQKSEIYSFYNLAHEITIRHNHFHYTWMLEKFINR